MLILLLFFFFLAKNVGKSLQESRWSLILDCCNSGGMGPSSQGRRENPRGPGQNFIRHPYDVIIFKQQD